jgi:hypothetical protein
MDDLLADPGVLVGRLSVETCTQDLSLLQGLRLDGTDPGPDAAYPLARELLAAQLNLAATAEYCPASDRAVQAAQLLLISLSFDGTGAYLGPMDDSSDRAQTLTDVLAQYNAGGLCLP